MRFTLDPGGDVHVPPGIELAACRPGLVDLVGSSALRHAPLRVGGRLLAEDQVSGVEPWVPGCRVTVGDPAGSPRAPDPGATGRRDTAHGRRQVVVVDGPDTGTWVDAGRRVVVGRAATAGLRLDTTSAAGCHGVLRRAAGIWWWADRTRAGLLRPVGRGVTVGDDVLVPVRLPRARAEPPPGPVWAWLTPAVATVVMAVALRTPVLAVLALGTLAPLAPRLARPARRRPWGPGPAEATVLAARGAEPEIAWWDAAREGLALVGGRDATLAAARALLGAALLDPRVQLTLAVGGARASDWQWCRWVERVRVGLPTADADPSAPTTGAEHRHLVVADGAARADLHRWWSQRGDAGFVVLVDHPDDAPAWCRHLVRAERDVPTASAAWVEEQARRIAARSGPGARLPTAVPLADLLRDAAATSPGLSAPLGLGPAGPVVVDLVADGPHALVAGTTGAGKSELLQTLVLALASRYGPDRLALVLVDFKGGAGLGACHRLPHVVGTVTDLDPRAAARALAGVRAELRRREGLLAAAGVGDLDALRAVAPAPPRLLVVVDELLALREDLPDVLPALVRLASQGRSLGIHLVLATQRPAGALDAQVRANVGVRLCLRVTDTSDSLDVVGTADAAQIPADLPGRAVLRRGDRPPEPVQTAWAALPPTADGPTWAPPWPPARTRRAGRPDQVATVVDALVAVADGHRPAPLWRPPLPERCTADQIGSLVGGPDEAGVRTGPGLVVGLVDRPDAQRTAPLAWQPDRGPLLVTGPPGSGRSTALRTVAQAALAAGHHVHVLHAGSWQWPPGPTAGRGTCVGADDPRRMVRLVELLASGVRPDLLVVDDAGAVARAAAGLPRGIGDALLESARATGVPLACAGSARDLRLLGTAGLTVRLGPDEDAAPRHRDPVSVPGRGVREPDGATCHVALPAARADPHPGPTRSGPPVLRVAPLPLHVDDLGPGRPPWAVPIGRGGDEARLLTVDLGRGLLVCGPPGSGRTSVLDVVAAHLPQGVTAVRPGPRELAEAIAGRPDADAPRVLLLDDVDLTLRDRPDLDERLTSWVLSAESGDPHVPRVVATARTDRVAAAFRGVLAALRSAGAVLVCDPLAPGSAEAVGCDLSRACDPRRVPGRAVLVVRGTAVPLQLAAPRRTQDR